MISMLRKKGRQYVGHKGIAILLVIAIIFSSAGPAKDTQAASEKNYMDVKGHKYEAALNYAIKYGLLKGQGKKLSPNSKITRGEVINAFVVLLGATKESDEIKNVIDVKKGSTYYNTMAVALNAELVNPDAKKKLYPEKKATEEYVAKIIAKLTDSTEKEVLAKKKADQTLTKGEFAALLKKFAPNIVTKSTSSVVKENVVVNKPGLTLKNMTITGNLIIGDGAGDKEITLKNVTVKGKTIVRGGSSVKLTGTSEFSSIITQQVNNAVSIKVQGNAKVPMVYVNDGSNDVNIVGAVGKLIIAGEGIHVTAKDATIEEVILNAGGIQFNTMGKTQIGNVLVEKKAKKAIVNVGQDTNIEKVEIQGENTSLFSVGTIKVVKLDAPNVWLEAKEDTKVEVGKNGSLANPKSEEKSSDNKNTGNDSTEGNKRGDTKVSYDLNGGMGIAPTSQQARTGSNVIVAEIGAAVPPVGKVFKEWNTQSDGNGQSYSPGTMLVMGTANIVFYAIWEDAEVEHYILSIKEEGNGRIEASAMTAPAGAIIDVIVTPAEGYQLVEDTLKYNESHIEGSMFIMPAQNTVISANFEPIPEENKQMFYDFDGNGNDADWTLASSTNISYNSPPESGKGLKTTNTSQWGSSWAYNTNIPWNNYIMEGDLTFLTFTGMPDNYWPNAALVCRMDYNNEKPNGYAALISPSQVELKKLSDGSETGLGSRANVSTSIGTTRHIKLVVDESNIALYVDNSLVTTVNDTDYSSGYIGIKTYESTAFFDNIKITEIKKDDTGDNLSDGITYYVDSKDGNDTNDGKSQEGAWKTIDKVNSTTFEPGDKILFKAGSVWDNSTFMPNGSGTVEKPIIVDVYGDISDENNKPLINANQQMTGQVSAGIVVENVEYWEINNLQITNMGDRNGIEGLAECFGVYIISKDYGTMNHIYIRNLYVHDIYGKLAKGNDEGAGIFFHSGGPDKSKLNDLRIEYNHLERVVRNGIGSMYGFDSKDWQSPYTGVGITEHPYRHSNVFIRGNLLEGIAGDGIKVWGCNGALVEHNILHGAEMGAMIRGRDKFSEGDATQTVGASAGIWPFDCDNTIIQYNEVSGVSGTIDGQAFDIDYFTTNTVIQYNYSHDNMGGFMLLCAPGWAHSTGNVVRYNISQNDGSQGGWNSGNKGRLIQHAGGNTDTQIYNNTFYIGPNQKGYPLFDLGSWDGGVPQNITFTNNAFIVESTELSAFYEGNATQQWSNFVWKNNVFMGAGFAADGKLASQMPSGQNVLPDATPSEYFYAPGQAMFGMAEAQMAYTPKDGRLLVGAHVEENTLVTKYHLSNNWVELDPGDNKYPYILFYYTNYNSGKDFGGNAVNTSAARYVGAMQAGTISNMLPAPIINDIGISSDGKGITVSYTPVSGASNYRLIYGKAAGFGYDMRSMNCSGGESSFTIANYDSTDEYIFTVCAYDENGKNGFYSPEKRFTLTEQLVNDDFSQADLTTFHVDSGTWGYENNAVTANPLSIDTDTWSLYNMIQNPNGTFTATNSITNGECSSGFAGDKNWTNYELIASMKNNTYGQWGCQSLWVRSQGNNSGFEIVFNDSQIQIKRNGTNVKNVDYTFPETAMVTAKITAIGNVITVYVKEDNIFVEKISYTDANLTNPSGQIGLGTWQATATFTDIMVNELDGDADVYQQTNTYGGRAVISGLQANYAQVKTDITIKEFGTNGKVGFIMGDYGVYLDGSYVFVTDENDNSTVIGRAPQSVSVNTGYNLSAEYVGDDLVIKVNNTQVLNVKISDTKLNGIFALDMVNATAQYGSLYIKQQMPTADGVDANPRFQLPVSDVLPEPEPVELNSPYQDEI